jgi:7-cyano-7-deazaguanine synthase
VIDSVLLSGGIDSIALAHWKRPQLGITVDYGQKPAQGEIRAAKRVCKELNIAHEVLTVDCRFLGSGDLAGKPPIPTSVSSEWWPFRNQLLITLAGMRAISLGVQKMYFGAVKSDAFHADGRKEFFKLADHLMKMQEGAIEIIAPAVNMPSSELVKVSRISFDLLAWSHSCHTSNFACGECRGCFKHAAVMKELGYEGD